MQLSTLLPLAILSLASASLLIDYTGGDPANVLGNVELEGSSLGDHVDESDDCFIKPGEDPDTGKQSLHYHRSSDFRRAEVKTLANKIQEDKTYYIGYNLRLTQEHESLVIFQWKKYDKTASPVQNIPFHLEFKSSQLTLAYTVPDEARKAVAWSDFSIGEEHHIGLAINTADDGSGWLEYYIDGEQQKFDGADRLEGARLFTGPTGPKFGIYRGEGSGEASEFDSYVYRVMISDESFDEVEEAAGISGSGSGSGSSGNSTESATGKKEDEEKRQVQNPDWKRQVQNPDWKRQVQNPDWKRQVENPDWKRQVKNPDW